MQTDNGFRSRLPAIVCAITLLICAAVTYPVAEIGMMDDFSYFKTAQVLSQTGHLVYNGWATAMLGWQLYLGALFIKLFGASFTSVRLSTLIVALATAFLTQRTMVRAGIGSRNAVIGTFALVLSPMFIPLSVSFMSDIGGLFFIVLCLYCCFRALQAGTDRGALSWLVLAGLSNAIGGTARQIAWLGVLVMFPCTAWLLRKRKNVWLVSVPVYLISIAIVFGSLRWFGHQPYSVPEPLLPGAVDRQRLNLFVGGFFGIFFDFAMYLTPFMVAFVYGLTRRTWRIAGFIALASSPILLVVAIFLQHRHRLGDYLAPSKGDYFTPRGLVYGPLIKGDRPVILSTDLRYVLTALVIFALICFFAFLLNRPKSISRIEQGASVTWRDLLVLFVPFSGAYIVLMLHRAMGGGLLDRYLLPLILVGFVVLIRLFQDSVQPDLPLISVALVVITAIFAVAGTHDVFSMYRARRAAIDELISQGVPNNAIDGGFEYDGMVQIDRFGYINDPRIKVPADAYAPHPSAFPDDCQLEFPERTPAIIPGYALSFNPVACGGPAGFAPVTYHEWLGPHAVNIYIVKTLKDAGATH